jgi:hypothetical protein
MTGSIILDAMLYIDMAVAALTLVGFLALPFFDN